MTPPPPGPEPEELAKAARLHARVNFLHAVDLGQEVREVTGKVQEHMRRNNFAELLDEAWRRGHR